MTAEPLTLAARGATQPDPPPVDAVAVDDLARSYRAVRAVDGVTLRVRRGETVALLGPNGAGKTTLINLLLGLLDPDRGTVRLQGLPPRAAISAGRVGAVLQDGGLMPGARVRDLLRLVRCLYPDPLGLDEACGAAQVGDFLGQRVDRLSGGQTQRVRVALALIGNPDLLLLDEPTVAMDVEARRHFWEGMDEQAARGRTILFSTHNLEEADSHAGRVLVLARGRLLADGTPASIKAMVGLRSLRCRVGRPEVADTLRGLPEVTGVRLRGDRLEVLSADTDTVLRRLLALDPRARDIEVTGLGLEAAFLALTSGTRPGGAAEPPLSVGGG